MADERLAFSFGQPTVPSQPVARPSGAEPTFATAPYSEPRDWGYTGLLAFTAVLLLRPQDHVPGLAALHLAELCALIGIGPMLIHRFVNRQPVFRVTPEIIALAGFGLVMLATVPFSIWPGGAVEEFLNAYVKIFIVFVLMMNTLTTPKRIEQLTLLIVLCCGCIAALAVIDYARGENLVEGGRLAGPVGGIFGNPNDLALNMVTFMPVAAVVAMTRGYSTPRRLLGALFFGLMLATVVFTKSRGGAIGLVAMLVSLVFLTRTVRPTFGVAVVAAILLSTPFVPASYWVRMSSILNEQQDARQFTGSRETRWIVMEEGIRTFLERPFTGVGAGQFKNYNYPGRQERWREAHNVIIQVAADIGIFGLAFFCYLLARAGFTAISLNRMLGKGHPRRGPTAAARVLAEDERQTLRLLAIGTSAAFVGWFTCALFASVAYNWTFYYVLALIVSSRELIRDRIAAAEPRDAASRAAGRHPDIVRRQAAPGVA